MNVVKQVCHFGYRRSRSAAAAVSWHLRLPDGATGDKHEPTGRKRGGQYTLEETCDPTTARNVDGSSHTDVRCEDVAKKTFRFPCGVPVRAPVPSMTCPSTFLQPKDAVSIQ